MSEETEVKIEEVVARSQEEAQKLTETIDQWNRQRGYKPLLHSREKIRLSAHIPIREVVCTQADNQGPTIKRPANRKRAEA